MDKNSEVPVWLSRCIVVRGEVQEADSAASVVRTKVYFVTLRDNDSETAVVIDTGTAVETAVEAAVEAVVDKRQVAVRNLVDSVVDTPEGLAVRNLGVGNPADYIVLAVRTPAAVAPAGVRWEYDPRSPVRQKISD